MVCKQTLNAMLIKKFNTKASIRSYIIVNYYNLAFDRKYYIEKSNGKRTGELILRKTQILAAIFPGLRTLHSLFTPENRDVS